MFILIKTRACPPEQLKCSSFLTLTCLKCTFPQSTYSAADVIGRQLKVTECSVVIVTNLFFGGELDTVVSTPSKTLVAFRLSLRSEFEFRQQRLCLSSLQSIESTSSSPQKLLASGHNLKLLLLSLLGK